MTSHPHRELVLDLVNSVQSLNERLDELSSVVRLQAQNIEHIKDCIDFMRAATEDDLRAPPMEEESDSDDSDMAYIQNALDTHGMGDNGEPYSPHMDDDSYSGDESDFEDHNRVELWNRIYQTTQDAPMQTLAAAELGRLRVRRGAIHAEHPESPNTPPPNGNHAGTSGAMDKSK